MKKIITLVLLLLITWCITSAKDDQKVPPRSLRKASAIAPAGFSHKVGALWTQITNYGFYGDRAYAEPNFEWPGGSGTFQSRFVRGPNPKGMD